MARILIAIALWLAAAQAVVAHAVLLDATPAADAALAEAPAEVVLRFNEPVAPVAVRLLDDTGTPVASEAVARDDTVVLPLPSLDQGGYLLSWRVVSTDAHPVSGAFGFTIGDAHGAIPELRSTDWTIASAIHRATYLSLLLLGAGGAVFLALHGRSEPALLQNGRRLLLGAALLALCLTPMQGALLLGQPPESLPLGELIAAGSTSPVARGGIAASLLLTIAAGLLGRAPAAAAIAAVTAVATLGLSGHAATASPRWLAAPALTVHAALAGLWAGALLPLRACVTRLPAQEGAALLRDFSRRAVPGVAALIAAGGILMMIQVRGLAGLATPYGAVLAAKLAGVAILLAIAIRNRNRLTPLFAAGAPDAVRRLRLSIGVEAAVMVGVIASVATLGHLPPPRALAALPEAPHAGHGNHAMATLTAEALGYRMQAELASHDGQHRITARFEGPDGQPVTPLEAEIAFSMPERGIEPILRPMARQGDAFGLSTRDMSLAGEWRIEVAALISAFERARFTTSFRIEP